MVPALFLLAPNTQVVHNLENIQVHILKSWLASGYWVFDVEMRRTRDRISDNPADKENKIPNVKRT